jgi:ABC-type transport system involved in cytochrome bd biosynthesis fused ATPase/permease subunit
LRQAAKRDSVVLTRAVLLATHHRDEAENADRLLWIERGKVIQIANKGEAAFDAILRQLNPRALDVWMVFEEELSC